MIGIHHDIPVARYHADDFGDVPTLSSSIAKILLAQTPAHAWVGHPRLNTRDDERDDDGKFDLGSAAHEIILGRGSGIDVVEHDDWRSKVAKEARQASRAAGRTPMLAHQYERAHEISRAAWSHPHAPYSDGDAETVLVWQDIGGPLCRAMLDHLQQWKDAAVITDVKTTDVSLTDASLARMIVNLGYDLSAAFYLRGLITLRPWLAGRIRFRWHFVETQAPFGSRMVEADPFTLTMGDRKAGLAIATWARCLEADAWPCWPADVTQLAMPPWVEAQQIERELTWPDAATAVFTDTMPAYETPKLMGAC